MKNKNLEKRISRTRFRRFNLVEITLAIGVIAFGMTSVVTMCLTALNQGRSAVGEAMASGIAENLFGLFSAVGRIDTHWSDGIFLSMFDNGTQEEKLTCGVNRGRMQTYKQTVKLPVKGYANSSDPKIYLDYQGNINASENDGDHGMWICRIYSGEPGDPRVEFSAFVRSWFAGQPIAGAPGGVGGGKGLEYLYMFTDYGVTADPSNRQVLWDMDGSQRGVAYDTHSYLGLYVEVSWPINQPESKRQKRVFYREIDE